MGCIRKLTLTLSFNTDLAYQQVFTVYTLVVGVAVILVLNCVVHDIFRSVLCTTPDSVHNCITIIDIVSISACPVATGAFRLCKPTGQCMNSSQICDSLQDCPDDSDEVNCSQYSGALLIDVLYCIDWDVEE